MRLTLLALAAGLIAASATTASALPAAKPKLDGVSNVEQVVDRDRRRMLRKQDRSHRHHWRRHNGIDWSDRRYSRYRGWHHYNSRPYGWRNRGCVAIGPIWFCP